MSLQLWTTVCHRVTVCFQHWFNESQDIMCNGRPFHRQRRLDHICDLETCKGKLWDDLRGLVTQCCCNKHEMYSGARPCNPLKTIIKTLDWILKSTGSQCSAASTGEMPDHFLVPVNSLAAAFCTRCSRESRFLDNPKYRRVAIIQPGLKKNLYHGFHVLERQNSLQFGNTQLREASFNNSADLSIELKFLSQKCCYYWLRGQDVQKAVWLTLGGGQKSPLPIWIHWAAEN